ncbi:MAG: 3-keto-disaccharide hydrolase [Phycisphaerales bacterium]
MSTSALLCGCQALPATAQSTTQPAEAATPVNQLSPAERAAGWQLLFDGTSTEHWRGYKREAFPEQGWTIEDDAIKVIEAGGGGDIMTVKQFENFEFSLEYRVAPAANSGIIYRVQETEDTTWQTGPEFQVLDDQGHAMAPTHIHSAGAMYDLVAPPEDKVVLPTGEWNTVRIIINNGHLRHWLNEKKIVDIDLNGDAFKALVAASKFRTYSNFGTNTSGHIALQDHGNNVWYRNIKIRDLDAPAPGAVDLFENGMNAWTTFFADEATSSDTFSFDEESGILECTGQPIGYLRTKDMYESFVLTLDWRWDKEKGAGNNGVLVRMDGNDTVWPRSIEAQLHSGNAGDFYSIGDFPMTTDADRRNGRHTRKMVAAENPVGEWNHYEIIVNGDVIDLFINGEHVNHAEGVEVMPGHICLQSEGAPIQFRNVHLTPIDE